MVGHFHAFIVLHAALKQHNHSTYDGDLEIASKFGDLRLSIPVHFSHFFSQLKH